MARKRMIDPSFWEDEGIGSLNRDERLFFIGCFSNADDEGRLVANAHRLKSAIFSYDDDLTPADVLRIRDSVAGKLNGLSVYEVQGKEYICLTHWDIYQSINHPTPSRLPAPPLPSLSRTATVVVQPASLNTPSQFRSDQYSLDQYSLDQSTPELSTSIDKSAENVDNSQCEGAKDADTHTSGSSGVSSTELITLVSEYQRDFPYVKKPIRRRDIITAVEKVGGVASLTTLLARASPFAPDKPLAYAVAMFNNGHIETPLEFTGASPPPILAVCGCGANITETEKNGQGEDQPYCFSCEKFLPP